MKKTLLFLLLFLFSCNNDYQNYHEEKQNLQTQNDELKSQISDFNLEKIKYLSWITLNSTPDTKYLDNLVKKIENAKTKIWVEVYIFTEKRLKNALIKARKSWVKVEILLEKNVYMASNLNKKFYDEFKKAWIDVRYSNSKNYALNHTKMMIIDDEVILSTWNYSYSSFKYNREFFLSIKNPELLKKFEEIFSNDFAWIKKNIYDDNLVLSPFYSRDKMEYLIKNAKNSIKIYSHNFWDENMLNLLKDAQKSWKEVKVIFPSLKKVSSNKEEIEELKNAWINLKTISKPEIHAKTILIDDKYLYIWSVNFSSASMNKNREVGILLSNEEIIKQFLDIFNDDFN